MRKFVNYALYNLTLYMLKRSYLHKISYHGKGCWTIFNMCLELFYKMSSGMTGTQISKLPNWYFAEKIFHVAFLLRYHIFHAKFTHLFVFIVDNRQLYYQILQVFFLQCQLRKKKKKATGKTKRKDYIIYVIVEFVLT